MKLTRNLLNHIMFNHLAKSVPVIGLCIVFFFCTSVLYAQTATIPLKDLPRNSRLAIWGDSITENTLYPRFVEMYLLVCAGRKDIKVCTFGHSGETLGGLISRQSDLEAFKPTIVSFNYGMNDSQYSLYTYEKGFAYVKTMRSVLAMLYNKGIKQRIVAGPDAVDDNFNRDTPEAFFHGANSGGLTAAQAQNVTLRHFRDFGRSAAVETGSAFADIHNRMLDSYTLAKKDLGSTYGLGVHPTPNGHFLIAYELLNALSCDGDIGSIDIDMHGNAQASSGHSVDSYSKGIVVLDSSKYPFCYNYDSFSTKGPDRVASILPYVSFSKDLNRFILKVTNLDATSAGVTWGSQTRSFTRDQLANGINLTEQFSCTPFDTTFSQIMRAIGDKQDFENYMIKGTSNYFGNDNGGNFDENMIAVHAQKDATVKALIVPVRHTIAIIPVGASEKVAPVITGTMMAYATSGQPFTYQPAALHSPTGFTAIGLPKGLTIASATGEITGVPTEMRVYSIALNAANVHGKGAATLTLAVTPPLPDLPVVTGPDAASGKVGVAFTYQIIATNNPTHYFATSPGTKGIVPPASSLPAGLAYNPDTGLLFGTPSAAGTYPIQVAAMNKRGVVTRLLTLTVIAN